jgi:hypothetical protein
MPFYCTTSSNMFRPLLMAIFREVYTFGLWIIKHYSCLQQRTNHEMWVLRSRSVFEAGKPRLPSCDSRHVPPPRFYNSLYHRWAAPVSKTSHLFSKHVTICCSAILSAENFQLQRTNENKTTFLRHNWGMLRHPYAKKWILESWRHCAIFYLPSLRNPDVFHTVP